MIELLLSGEGNSDMGEEDRQSGAFVLGPIGILTKNMLCSWHKYDVNFHFEPRSKLKRYPMTLELFLNKND